MSALHLGTGERYGRQIMDWLAPYCDRMMVVGSIRRERPIVNDIDIVCIPKWKTFTETVDMFSKRTVKENLCYKFLHDYVEVEKKAKWRSKSNQPNPAAPAQPCKQMLITLKNCELDLWFADGATWATRVLCRTGSVDHNIWLAERYKKMGMHWNPYEGIKGSDGQLTQFVDEEGYYSLAGLPFIPPIERELTTLRGNFGS